MILRIAHIADSHFDERNRLEDNVAVHRALLDQLEVEVPDLILHAGDFFERRSTPAERNALADFIMEAASIAPVVGVKGNHDAEKDLRVFQQLYTDHTVDILERPGSPEVETGAACVLCLPWFDKSHLIAQLPPDAPADETTARTIQAARALLHGLRAKAGELSASGGVPILLGHVLVAGSETSTGQTLIGQTVELAPGDLADVGCAYVALGHIHKAQSWGRVHYSGSPQRHNFGETERKGWNLVEIDTARWREPNGVLVQFRELPARAIRLIEHDCLERADLEDLGAITVGAGDWSDLRGALVRVRYRIRPEDLHLVDEASIERALRTAGVHDVKLEAVLVHQDRQRAPEIVAAKDTWEKVSAYWLAKGIDVPEANRARIRAKLEELEQRQQEEVAA